MHRGIKTDNVLVFTLDEVITANGKLTDFGNPININPLMIRVRFTKGLLTPANGGETETPKKIPSWRR